MHAPHRPPASSAVEGTAFRLPGAGILAPYSDTARWTALRRPAPRTELDAVLGHAPPDRLTVAVVGYLLFPALLFLAGWAQPWVGLVGVVTGLASLAYTPGWREAWPVPRAVTALCLCLGLLWAGGTGAHHLVYSTADWQIRDAVLRDLASGPWPVAYAMAEGDHWLLRAPLGLFLPAGLVGRFAGFPAAQAALWAWTGLGLGLCLALLATLARALAPTRPRAAFAVLAGVFVLFHGLDILPNALLDGRAGAGAFASWGRGGEWWDRLFQYTGHVTVLLWAPNHAMPAWLVALLLLRHWQAPGFARSVAVPLAAGAFWSPVAAGGAAVLALAALLRQGWDVVRRAALAPANLLILPLALPVCLYLVAGAAEVPHGPLWWHQAPDVALGRWALLLAVEVLCWAALAAALVRGWLLRAAVAMLCLLPAYVFGPGNEMTSRGGLAPLAILAVVVAAALLAPAPDRARRLARAGLLACAVLAAAGAAMEASLLVTHRAWPASPECSVPEAARQSVFRDSTDWSHYHTEWPDPLLESWLAAPLLRPIPPRGQSPPCWPRGHV